MFTRERPPDIAFDRKERFRRFSRNNALAIALALIDVFFLVLLAITLYHDAQPALTYAHGPSQPIQQ